MQLELRVGRLLVRIGAGLRAESDAVLGQRRPDVQRMRSVGQRGRVPLDDTELQRRGLR